MDTSFLTLRRLRSLRLNSLLFGCGLVVALRSLRRRGRSGVLAGESPRRSLAAPLPTTRTRNAPRKAQAWVRAQEDSKTHRLRRFRPEILRLRRDPWA